MINWNYAWKGHYFITICTKNRRPHFGTINDQQMTLSPIGKIVQSEWLITPQIRPDMNLEIGPYVIMPNHFHAIISIGRNKYNNFTPQNNLQITTAAAPLYPSHKVTVPLTTHPCRTVTVPETTYHTPPTTNQHPCRTVTVPVTIYPSTPIHPCPKATHSYTFGNQSKNLAAIIGGFKSAVTRKAKLIDANFAWQRRYHDHLIRDQKSFDNISNYIKANIKNWKVDRFS